MPYRPSKLFNNNKNEYKYRYLSHKGYMGVAWIGRSFVKLTSLLIHSVFSHFWNTDSMVRINMYLNPCSSHQLPFLILHMVLNSTFTMINPYSKPNQFIYYYVWYNSISSKVLCKVGHSLNQDIFDTPYSFRDYETPCKWIISRHCFFSFVYCFNLLLKRLALGTKHIFIY